MVGEMEHGKMKILLGRDDLLYDIELARAELWHFAIAQVFLARADSISILMPDGSERVLKLKVKADSAREGPTLAQDHAKGR